MCGHAGVKELQNRAVLTEDAVVIVHGNGANGAGQRITMLRSQHMVLIDNATVNGPPMKEFNLDKSQVCPEARSAPLGPKPGQP